MVTSKTYNRESAKSTASASITNLNTDSHLNQGCVQTTHNAAGSESHLNQGHVQVAHNASEGELHLNQEHVETTHNASEKDSHLNQGHTQTTHNTSVRTNSKQDNHNTIEDKVCADKEDDTEMNVEQGGLDCRYEDEGPTSVPDDDLAIHATTKDTDASHNESESIMNMHPDTTVQCTSSKQASQKHDPKEKTTQSSMEGNIKQDCTKKADGDKEHCDDVKGHSPKPGMSMIHASRIPETTNTNEERNGTKSREQTEREESKNGKQDATPPKSQVKGHVKRKQTSLMDLFRTDAKVATSHCSKKDSKIGKKSMKRDIKETPDQPKSSSSSSQRKEKVFRKVLIPETPEKDEDSSDDEPSGESKPNGSQDANSSLFSVSSSDVELEGYKDLIAASVEKSLKKRRHDTVEGDSDGSHEGVKKVNNESVKSEGRLSLNHGKESSDSDCEAGSRTIMSDNNAHAADRITEGKVRNKHHKEGKRKDVSSTSEIKSKKSKIRDKETYFHGKGGVRTDSSKRKKLDHELKNEESSKMSQDISKPHSSGLKSSKQSAPDKKGDVLAQSQRNRASLKEGINDEDNDFCENVSNSKRETKPHEVKISQSDRKHEKTHKKHKKKKSKYFDES